ncbi:putative inorganic phosphate cotransporter isoform X2 [Cylas formicarius]|uniref:putative inorganic phosphate cotransporter isoform X2 n=1 Tax=Cylas formicarius TaxID=197179 RepID=UPI00295859DB|nr:putative inorganic phosphate cotransporter isoform X2 [Cylas formicarius]
MGRKIKIRYIQMTLLFFLMGFSYAIRTILSVSIVAMTGNSTSTNEDIPTFNWSNTGVILSSFYWSYAVMQFFSGQIGHNFGLKYVLASAMFVNSLASVLIPILSIHFGSAGIIFCRVIQGISQGFILPLCHNMIGKWAPTEERSWINTSVYSGCSFGTIISMPVTAYLSSSGWGWPASFYIFGGLGLVWCLFWLYLSAESPASHKSISDEEKKYIENSLGQRTDVDDLKNIKIPWRAIFTSLPYWAIILGAVGESWGSTFLITEIPTYLEKTTGFDIEATGWTSSAPYIVALIFTILYGPIADYLIYKGYTSRINSRRIFHGIGSFIPAGALIWLAYEESRVGIAILLIVAISLNGAMFCGHNVNHIDISPRFSGILFGFSNGIGQTLAILAPLLVQFVVTDETDKSLWRIMFIVAAVIYASTAIFFMINLSAERQWWDSGRESRNSLNLVENKEKDNSEKCLS